MSAAENDYRDAYQAALAFLGPRARTVWEVRERLRRREFSAAVVDQVIEALTRLGLLDDHAFCRHWIESSQESKKPAGAPRLRQDLRRKGVEPDTVREILAEFEPDLGTESAALGLLRHQWSRYAGLDELRAKRRMLGLLSRRGYEHEAAMRAVEQVWEEKQRDDVKGD